MKIKHNTLPVSTRIKALILGVSMVDTNDSKLQRDLESALNGLQGQGDILGYKVEIFPHTELGAFTGIVYYQVEQGKFLTIDFEFNPMGVQDE